RRIARRCVRARARRGTTAGTARLAMIAAIWQAQYRAMRFFGRGSAFGMIAGAIWYGGWLAIACGVAYWTAIATAAALARGVAWGLLGVFLYWQFVPLIFATMGASVDMR